MGRSMNNSQQTNLSIKNIYMITLSLVVLIFIISSVGIFIRLSAQYKEDQRIYLFNEISDNLFTAVANYGFERGRVNVVLNDAGPVAGMESNRQFILARRNEGDEALSNALSELKRNPDKNVQQARNYIENQNKKILELRFAAEKDLNIPLNQRQPGLPEQWFSEMTEYIKNIESLLIFISQDMSDADGLISRYSSLKHKILALRNTAGPEMSILSSL